MQCMEPLFNSHWSSTSPLSSSCLADLKELLWDTVGAVYLCFPHFEVVTFQGCLRIGVPVRVMLHPLLNWECLCPQPALCGRILLSSTSILQEDSLVLNLHYAGGFCCPQPQPLQGKIPAQHWWYKLTATFTLIHVGKISIFSWSKNWMYLRESDHLSDIEGNNNFFVVFKSSVLSSPMSVFGEDPSAFM